MKSKTKDGDHKTNKAEIKRTTIDRILIEMIYKNTEMCKVIDWQAA